MTWSQFAEMKAQPFQPGYILLYDYMRNLYLILLKWMSFQSSIFLITLVPEQRNFPFEGFLDNMVDTKRHLMAFMINRLKNCFLELLLNLFSLHNFRFWEHSFESNL